MTARNSSFTDKGRAVDVKQVGRDLGVRYVLEGSLRKSGSRIRITAQLVESETGNHVWAERYFSGEYEGTVEAARRLLHSYPDFPMVHRWSAAALGQLGRSVEAKEALNTAISLAPAAFEMYVRNRVPWFRPEDHAHLLEGLRKAGWEG